MPIQIHCVCCGEIGENAWLVRRDGRDDCVVIDPGDEYPKLKRALEGRRVAALSPLSTTRYLFARYLLVRHLLARYLFARHLFACHLLARYLFARHLFDPALTRLGIAALFFQNGIHGFLAVGYTSCISRFWNPWISRLIIPVGYLGRI